MWLRVNAMMFVVQKQNIHVYRNFIICVKLIDLSLKKLLSLSGCCTNNVVSEDKTIHMWTNQKFEFRDMCKGWIVYLVCSSQTRLPLSTWSYAKKKQVCWSSPQDEHFSNSKLSLIFLDLSLFYIAA